MQLNVRAPRALVEMKPPHGSPCNRCGLCCAASLCDIAQMTFRRPETPGPCPALLGSPGNASCGIVEDPARFAPRHVARHGAARTREAALILINAGHGCDMRINGECNDAYLMTMDEHDARNRSKIDAATELWRLRPIVSKRRKYFDACMSQELYWLLACLKSPSPSMRPIHLQLIRLAIRKKGGAMMSSPWSRSA